MIRVQAHCFLGVEAEAAVSGSLRDPRLGRLEPQMVRGGLRTAISRYGREPSPPLIIAEVEPDLEGPAQLLAAIAAFSEVCDVGSNLILLGGANDIDLYRALRRQGVADYIRLPLDHAQFRDSVQDLVEGDGGGQRGQCVAVIGAKGGCGSSSLAQNLAYLLSRGPAGDAVLLDLDLPFGAADLALALDAQDGMRSLLKETGALDQAVLDRLAVRYDDRLQLLAPMGTLDGDGRIEPDRLQLVLDALRRHYRWSVLDLPHGWANWVQRALRLADAVVVVSPVDLTAVRNCRNLLDWLARERPASAAPLIALVGEGEAKGALPHKDFCASLGIKDPILLPEDRPSMLAAMAEGRILADVRPNTPLVQGMRRAAAALGGAPAAPPAAGWPLLGRLLPRLAGRRG